MKISQSAPLGEYLAHKDEIDAAIYRVLESGWYILGSEVEKFEEEFARIIGREAAVGVASGTDALTLALRMCLKDTEDLVVTTSHTAVATVSAIEIAGGSPILIDIDEETYCMDPSRLQETVEAHRGRVKAVVPVHLYGHPADMTSILQIAASEDLAVVEDCAQAHGATISGRNVGTFGRFAAFSFYPTKNLGAMGDGGAIVTDADSAGELLALRQYGWRERFVSDFSGVNSRLDELQAAILRVKLRYLASFNDARRRISGIYLNGLKGLPLQLPAENNDARSVYHQFVVRTPKRDQLQDFLSTRGIGTAIHYPLPVHLQPAYASRVPLGGEGLPVTERIYREILSLPMHSGLTESDAGQVVEAIAEFFS